MSHIFKFIYYLKRSNFTVDNQELTAHNLKDTFSDQYDKEMFYGRIMHCFMVVG